MCVCGHVCVRAADVSACHSNVSRQGISCLLRQGHGDSDTAEQVEPTVSLQNSSSAASETSLLLGVRLCGLFILQF